LVNLISNAADAIDHGGTISVRATEFPDGKGVIIAVEDDGPGISEEGLGGIFEPFYTTKFSGTGLGLAVAKSLVDKHGGRIEVESAVGAGTTFFVLLPEADDSIER
jgi:signal transduction histidine kinase